MNLMSQNVTSVVLLAPKDATGAAQTGLGVNLKGYARCRINIVTGALTGSDTMNVTLRQGTAGAGSASALTGDKALEFDAVYVTDPATGLTTKTAVSDDTFAIANTVAAGTIYAIDVLADSLDATNSFVVVQPKVSSPGAHATLMAITADCYLSRYGGDAGAAINPLAD